jgi:2-polyprenyl-6-methoxyphenol hydroxylase-like FAD-dependent oxidoreductase
MTRSTAVIIGYSFAGACCARILSRVCDRVVVVERDELPAGPVARTGVPQGRHAHMILDRGRRELEHLFPGFERTLVERGGVIIDPGLEFASYGRTGWAPRSQTTLRVVCASRDLTDAVVRELAAPAPHVEIRTGWQVGSLRVEGRRVTGVELRSRDGSRAESIDTALVVDASGRGSKLPALLEEAGIAPPDETTIDSGTWYSTRWFERRGFSAWWKAAILVPNLAGPGALLMPVEGDRWIVSIASVGRGQPAIDDSNYRAALEALRSPIIAEAVGAPVSPVHATRSTPNRFRHYHRWREPVVGIVPVGDATCALNPIHGQGVTCTAVCARILESCLAEGGVHSPTLASRFIRAQARWLAEPWGTATSFDLQFPNTAGKRRLAPKLFAPYMRLFAEAVREDGDLFRRVGEVGQLNEPMASLMAPRIVARVLQSAVRRRVNRVAPEASRTAAYPPPTIMA